MARKKKIQCNVYSGVEGSDTVYDGEYLINNIYPRKKKNLSGRNPLTFYKDKDIKTTMLWGY